MRPGTQARQQQILDAAARCFARNGFHPTTMQQICLEARLSPGSVYRYYTSKEELIGALIDQERAEALALIEAAGADPDPLAALTRLAYTALAELHDHQTAALDVEVAAEAVRSSAVGMRVRESYVLCARALAVTLENAQHERPTANRFDPRLLAELLLALFDGLTVRKAIDPELDTTSYADAVAVLLARLLQPAEER